MKNELFEKIFDMYFFLCYYKKEQWIGLLVHLFFKALKMMEFSKNVQVTRKTIKQTSKICDFVMIG